MSNQTSLRVADLPQNAPTPFDLRPEGKAKLDDLASVRWLAWTDVINAGANWIDAEVATLVRQAESRAKQLLKDRRKGLASLAQALEKHETLEGEELFRALDHAKIKDSDRVDPGAKVA